MTHEEIEALYKQSLEEKNKEREAKKADYVALRNSTVNENMALVHKLSVELANAHAKIMQDMIAFREVMNEFGDLPKNSKGGFSIENEDNNARVRLKIRVLGDFDERADLAEQHLRAFFEKTLKISDPVTFDMIMKLLERKKGKLEYSRVMQILSFEDKYTDADWKTGCKLLKESFRQTGSKNYLEFEFKDENNQWLPIALNFSSL
jgi:hypothetical protein